MGLIDEPGAKVKFNIVYIENLFSLRFWFMISDQHY